MARNKIQDEDDLWMEHLLNEVDGRLNGTEIESEKYGVESLNKEAFTANELENETDELEDIDEINQQSTQFTDGVFTCFILLIFLFACVIIYIQFLNL